MTENKPKTSGPTQSRSQNDRPTVGFLTHEIWGTFGSLFWSGIINATEEEDANLICFPGGNLRPAQEAPANVIYDLAGDQNVDGLVISASSLGSFIKLEDFGAFCERYSLAHPTKGREDTINQFRIIFTGCMGQQGRCPLTGKRLADPEVGNTQGKTRRPQTHLL